MGIYGKAQVIFDFKKEIYYSYDSLDYGFKIFEKVPITKIFKGAESLLVNYFKLIDYKIILVKERTWGYITEYSITLETISGTFSVIVLYDSSSSKYSLGAYTRRESGIGQQTAVPEMFSNSSFIDNEKALKSP